MDMAMVMAMATNIVKKSHMIDIHSHVLFGVDDGAKDVKESLAMIREYIDQGVKSIFCTPHVNSSVTISTREEQKKKFEKLKKETINNSLNLYFGAEIYISFRLPEIDYSKYTMGDSNFLLVEFSTYSISQIIYHLYNLIKKGYKIIIAHVERYEYLTNEDLIELKRMGAYLQVNASSVIIKKSQRISKTIKFLLKNNLIDFIASDAHNLSSRKIRLDETYKFIKKRYGNVYADKVFYSNQKKFLVD